jgi:hypothetical protein
MQDFPSLPAGPLGILALSASFSLFGLFLALLGNLLRRRWVDAIWALAPLTLLSMTMVFGARAPTVHAVVSVLALAVMFRNAVFFKGVARWASLVSAAACTNAIGVALWLF